jgi:hypothetical protein
MKRKDAPSDLQLPKRAMATSEIRSVPNLTYRTISHALQTSNTQGLHVGAPSGGF